MKLADFRVRKRIPALPRLWQASRTPIGTLGTPMSDDAVLRHLKRHMAAALPPPPVPGAGSDDYSWVKGSIYGTLIVHLEGRTVGDFTLLLCHVQLRNEISRHHAQPEHQQASYLDGGCSPERYLWHAEICS
jgi:hypothetical protein